jgi:hypothetical protein
MHPFKYEVTDMNADVILRVVPLAADYAASKGDKRITPSGVERKGPQPCTACTFSLGSAISSDEGVVDFLRRYNQKLSPCKISLERLV